MSKGIINLPKIWDSDDHWWVLNIVDGFGACTTSLKLMEDYSEYKVLALKEKGNTSHVCQSYDQDYVKQDNSSSRNDTSATHSCIPATIDVLNNWCLANVGLQAVKKLPRESWIYYFKKVNLHPKHRVYFSQWYDSIKLFLQIGYSFKKDTTFTIDDKYDILP